MPHGLAHAVHALQAAHASGAVRAGAPARARGLAFLAAEPIPGLSGRTAFALIAIVVVVIAAVAIVPLILDVRRATAWRQQITDQLIDRAADDHDVRDLLRDLREPRGVRGLTRSVIAVLILALVGLALAIAMLSSGPDSGDLRKTIVTSLMTVLATVAGFYFGTLGAQNSAEDARRHVASASALVKKPGAAPGAPATKGAAVAAPSAPAATDAPPTSSGTPATSSDAPATSSDAPDAPEGEENPGPAGDATA